MRRLWFIICVFAGIATLMCAVIFGAVYFMHGWPPAAPEPADTTPGNWFDEALVTTGLSENYEGLVRRVMADPDHEQIIADRLAGLGPNELMRMAELVSDLSGLEARDSYLPLLDTCFRKLPQRWKGMAVFGYGHYPWSKVGDRVRGVLAECPGDEHIENAVVAVVAEAWRNHPEPDQAGDVEMMLRSQLNAAFAPTRNRVIWDLVDFGWMKADEAETLLDALLAEHPELENDWPTEYTRKFIADQRKGGSGSGG